MGCDLIDISDCKDCNWLAYSPAEDKEVCVLNGDRPIDEIGFCNFDEVMNRAEELVIEEGRRRDE